MKKISEIVNSIAQAISPVVGVWESSVGTSFIDLKSDGTGSKTVMGITSTITWKIEENGTYTIDGLNYTLDGHTLKGPIATYHKR